MQNDKKSAKIFMMPESESSKMTVSWLTPARACECRGWQDLSIPQVIGDDAVMKSSSPRILVGDGASSTPGLTSLGLTITSSPLGDSFCVMSLHDLDSPTAVESGDL